METPPLARRANAMARVSGKQSYPRRTPERRAVPVQPVRKTDDSAKTLERRDVRGAISFSLFGSAPIYCIGAIRNVELAREIYPNWKVIIYCAPDVPKATTVKLGLLGAEVRGGIEGINNVMFLRFAALDDASFSHVIFRDCDSRLSMREARAVAEWIESGKKFHSCRDHTHHHLPLGGGLWGATRGSFPNITEAIRKSGLASEAYKRETGYGRDQTFLTRFVWPVAKESCEQHDSFHRNLFPGSKPLPDGLKWGQYRFVGEIVGADEKPHPTHWMMRINEYA